MITLEYTVVQCLILGAGGIILSELDRSTVVKAGEWPHVRLHVVIRGLLILIGTASLALAIVGIFLPLLPTTPFLLLTAACYASGSTRLSRWLLNNRWFGSYIRNYREGRGLTQTVKIISVLSLWITIGYSSLFAVNWLPGRLALLVIAICVTIHILTRPTYRPE